MRAFVIWLSVVMGLWAHAARADDYPTRSVKMIIPFPAGAGTDLTGRMVADELGKQLHQQFVVENKPGAAAQLGTDFVAKADPDGYTLLWTVSDGLSVLPAVKSLPYKVPDDFAFIGSIAQQNGSSSHAAIRQGTRSRPFRTAAAARRCPSAMKKV